MEAQLTELDKLYFPHEWQKRLPFDKVLENHIKFFNAETEKVKRHIRCEFDIPYGTLEREKYNIYGIDLPEDSPIIIHVHGGYWQVKEISYENQGYLAKVFHRHNIRVIALGYEVCPGVAVKDTFSEIEMAMKRCLQYAVRCKTRAIYLSGHSVGAPLIAALFSNFINTLSTEEQQLIQGVFLSCGLYDLVPLVKTIINQGLKLTEESAKEVSPKYMNITSPSHISFRVMVAENDSPAFLDQSKKFYEKLVQSNVKADFRILRDVDHFNAAEKLKEEDFEVTQLLLNSILKSK